MSIERALAVAELRQRHAGLDQGRAEMWCRTAAVALSRRHAPPAATRVDHGKRSEAVVLTWRRPDETTLASWADPAEATEHGAEAVAAVCIEATLGLVVVERARRGTRVDFYLGRIGDGLERAALLEVGGTDAGSIAGVLRDKTAQARQNPDQLPALAVAVRFREPRVMISDVPPGRR